jgi:hypothetical protein
VNGFDARRLRLLPEAAHDLVRFLCTHMVRSYKPVLGKIIVDQLPDTVIPISHITERFVEYYCHRAAESLPVERIGCPFVTHEGVDPKRALYRARKILYNVFYVAQTHVRFAAGMCVLEEQAGWALIAENPERQIAHRMMDDALKHFFNRILDAGEAVYVTGRDETQSNADMVLHLPDSYDDEPLSFLR